VFDTTPASSFHPTSVIQPDFRPGDPCRTRCGHGSIVRFDPIIGIDVRLGSGLVQRFHFWEVMKY
jgi:hypothetical protein